MLVSILVSTIHTGYLDIIKENTYSFLYIINVLFFTIFVSNIWILSFHPFSTFSKINFNVKHLLELYTIYFQSYVSWHSSNTYTEKWIKSIRSNSCFLAVVVLILFFFSKQVIKHYSITKYVILKKIFRFINVSISKVPQSNNTCIHLLWLIYISSRVL